MQEKESFCNKPAEVEAPTEKGAAEVVVPLLEEEERVPRTEAPASPGEKGAPATEEAATPAVEEGKGTPPTEEALVETEGAVPMKEAGLKEEAVPTEGDAAPSHSGGMLVMEDKGEVWSLPDGAEVAEAALPRS